MLLQNLFLALEQPASEGGPYKILLRCRAGLRTLGAVLRAALLTIFHSRSIQRAAHNVITNTRQILHTAAAHQHDRVLLQVMPDSWNVRGDFDCIGQADASHLA